MAIRKVYNQLVEMYFDIIIYYCIDFMRETSTYREKINSHVKHIFKITKDFFFEGIINEVY